MQQGGMEVPALQNRPMLNSWVSEYWTAFQLLGSSRAVTQGGIGSIPLSEIVAYMECVYVRDPDERLRFIMMIQGLDGVYVPFINNRSKQRHKSEEAKQKRMVRPRRRSR